MPSIGGQGREYPIGVRVKASEYLQIHEILVCVCVLIKLHQKQNTCYMITSKIGNGQPEKVRKRNVRMGKCS